MSVPFRHRVQSGPNKRKLCFAVVYSAVTAAASSRLAATVLSCAYTKSALDLLDPVFLLYE